MAEAALVAEPAPLITVVRKMRQITIQNRMTLAGVPVEKRAIWSDDDKIGIPNAVQCDLAWRTQMVRMDGATCCRPALWTVQS